MTLMTCVELVLMKRGNLDYILIQARFDALFNCEVNEYADHPKCLREALKDIYHEKYESCFR